MCSQERRDDAAPRARASGAAGEPQRESPGARAPSVALPKGGGAIRGIGEKFAANPVTGTGSFAVPIATSAGRSGFGPQLSITYDSGTDNGPFGFGWSLNLPSITRKTSAGLPQYEDGGRGQPDSDVFLLSGAEDLVPACRRLASGQWARNAQGNLIFEEDERDGYLIRRYRPRIEGLFARIERWTRADGDIHWRSISNDNVLTIYGKDANARIADPADPRRVFAWLICETRDDRGNAIIYGYKAEDGADLDLGQPHERNRGGPDDPRRKANRYVKRIRYGNRVPLLDGAGRRPRELSQAQIDAAGWLFEVVFDYDDHDPAAPLPRDDEARDGAGALRYPWRRRQDPFSSYRAGFEVRTTRLCQRVLMFHHFPGEPGVGADCLVGATEFTYSYEQNPADARNPIYSFLCTVTQAGYRRAAGGGYTARRWPPVSLDYSPCAVQEAVEVLDPASAENLPAGLDGASFQWVDLHGEGVPGLLTEQDGGWFYKRNLSPLTVPAAPGDPGPRAMFAPLEAVAVAPNVPPGDGAQFMDLAGDGQPDLVVLDGPAPGLFEHDEREGWQPFRPFGSRLTRGLNDPNLRLVDLDGDGHADVLITEEQAFVWHPSLAEGGFGPARRVPQVLHEERGPRLVFDDGTQSIYLADMSGDGLADLVRVRNGEVCYWPNLGYGRFGAKVMMDHAPAFDRPDLFEQRRIRLADIDGSGTSDIIYLHRDGVHLYFNQSGNSWSAPVVLRAAPRIDDLASVTTADLLGNGTVCLVFSSALAGDARRPVRYINLMGGQKPHLLVHSVNNLGAETHMHYVPSTTCYLRDKRAGRPWVTRLPFPVHVVERVEMVDLVSRVRFVTRYAYHHGYFDGEEREFRGFGMVEQWDTEAFEDYVVGVRGIDGTQELAPELLQPPVLTRTWYHTGAFPGQQRVLHQYRHEYYGQRQELPEPELPPGLDARELRECARALRGQPLRQEVYSFDGSTEASLPYTITENAYEVRLLQPRGQLRHAVFFPVSVESVSFNYERNAADPRISHTLALEVDAVGNVLKSCSVVYGRVLVDPTLPAEVGEQQRRRYVTYAETDYTGDIDQGAPTGEYRLRAPYEARSYEVTAIAPAARLFRRGELAAAVAGTAPLDYGALADDATPQRRLLSHDRTLFLSNALAPLPLGQWDTLGLSHESYELAFTPAIVSSHYAGEVGAAELEDAGYVHFGADNNWWIPSGTAVYPANPAAHFYLSIGARDALGVETIATLDPYDLLVEQVAVTQSAWNVVTAENDYRILGPVMLTDPNKNRSSVAIDELGMVVRTAVMGKAGANDGDTLADPTTRLEYELFNWAQHRKPNFAHSFAREEHGAGNPRWQESYAYSNGSGGLALTKSQVRPGRAVALGPGGAAVEVDADPRWVGNGRTILNNKGKPVKQYEPYFSATHEYEDERALREIGVTPIFFYDALGRNIRTLFPNNTFARVDFTPWRQRVFDANDTVKESKWYADRGSPDPAVEAEPTADPERRAAWLAAKHAGTPGMTHFDSLGRPIYAVADYGGGKIAAVRAEGDLTGRITRLFDQRGREVAAGFTGMAGHPLVADSAEKGRRWTFQNVLGALVRSWDEHGRSLRVAYDAVHRPLKVTVQQAGQAPIVVSYVVYGDRLGNAEQLNLQGVAHQIFDQAGVVRVPSLDFKGNPSSIERILALDYKAELDWSALPAQPSYAAIQAAASPRLEGEVFAASSRYDALSRPTRVTLPDGTVVLPAYDEAGLVRTVQAQIGGAGPFIEFLKGQEYDSKGQRLLAHYGNETFTRYSYDAATFRLTGLLTHKAGALPQTQSLQDLRYTYDPVGNITQIRDDAQQTHYFANAVVRPESLFEYDAVYQLIRAVGREHAALGNSDIATDADLAFVPQLPHANNAGAVRVYVEEYEYDLLGNLTSLNHRWNGSSWRRRYRYAYETNPADRTNRLAATSLPGDPPGGPFGATYGYDAYGNMTRMPHLPALSWNFLDQLRRAELGGGGTAYYVYGLGGQRLRKVIERNGNLRLEWISLGPVQIFRRRRRTTGELRFERWTVHISDNAGRIAQVDTKTRDDDNSDLANPLNTPLQRYQYTNHLGSAVLETDENGTPISYEEFHPYGTTAYRSAKPGFDLSLKRFRFSGKERDDESGLYYFGARYYAPWLGRWTSSDPAGFVDGQNLFAYCHNSPIVVKDQFGHRGGQQERHLLYSVQSDTFNGSENPTIDNFRRHFGPNFDRRITSANSRIFYEPRLQLDLESHSSRESNGGTWYLVAVVRVAPRPPPPPPQPPPPTVTPDPPPVTTPNPPPSRPLVQPGPVPGTPYQTDPVPKLDFPQANPGTDFAGEESSARANYRANAAASGRPMATGEQVQHPAKWRDGARTNLHPRITNNPRFLHPIQSRVNQMGGRTHQVGGRTYRTDHTYADRGLYPREARDTQRRYGSFATERVTHVWAGQRVRRELTGSRGPSFLSEYIVAPMVRGAAGHTALAATRTFVPFVVEAELGLMGAGMALHSAGYTAAGVTVFGAASYVPVVGGSLVAGTIAGNAAESLARDLGADADTAQGVGMLAAMGTGAAVGALIGSVIPGVGTAAGAVVGAIAGGIGYALSKLF